jgi:DNA-directed RNA polymerase specialized sigma24 family protein
MDSAARHRLNELMARLADGDRSAFDEVYAGLWPVVAAFCSRTLSHADAEDAAQQSLLKVFDQAANYERNRDGVTWALSIAMWEVRTIRKRHARSKMSDLDDFELPLNTESPEQLTADRQITDAAIAVLGQLSPEDQATLMATFNEEAPDGVGHATFRKRRERALGRLKLAWRRVYAN